MCSMTEKAEDKSVQLRQTTLNNNNHGHNLNDHEFDHGSQSCTTNEYIGNRMKTAISKEEELSFSSPVSATKSILFSKSENQRSKDPLVVLGVNLSNFPRNIQFLACAAGVVSFTIIYGYLQELLSVHILGRRYAMFLSLCQLAGYSFWSNILRIVGRSRKKEILRRQKQRRQRLNHDMSYDEIDMKVEKKNSDRDVDKVQLGPNDVKERERHCDKHRTAHDEEVALLQTEKDSNEKNYESEKHKHKDYGISSNQQLPAPPLTVYIALSFVRALDIGLTNGAMKFLNYPAKTLIKSSRVAFTMVTGVIIGKNKYSMMDYFMVTMLVFGLSVFLHADHRSRAVFHPIGVLMLVSSLCCDGIFNNYSELIMKKYRISQDQYQSSIYTVAFVLVLIGTIAKGELIPGFQTMFIRDGTVSEIEENKIGSYHHHREYPTYTRNVKCFIFFLFTFTGLFGSSCAGAITKTWGALRMSVTSTVRKAGTLFLSMAAPGFHNKCTPEHIVGMFIFISALFVQNFQRKKPRPISTFEPDVELEPCSSYDTKKADDLAPAINNTGLKLI